MCRRVAPAVTLAAPPRANNRPARELRRGLNAPLLNARRRTNCATGNFFRASPRATSSQSCQHGLFEGHNKRRSSPRPNLERQARKSINDRCRVFPADCSVACSAVCKVWNFVIAVVKSVSCSEESSEFVATF